MAESMTTYVAMLKEFYTAKKVEQMVYRNAPFLAMVPKLTSVEGETWDVPIYYGDPQAGSATFANAQAGKGNTSTDKFQLTTKNEYSFAAIERKVIKASKTDKGAFLPAVKPNVDGAFNTCRRSLGIQIYRDGSGAKGRIASGGGGANIVLADLNDAVNFQKGERLQFNPNKTGNVGTLRNAAGVARITDINRATGTLTIVDVDAGTVAAAADSDYIYRSGDYDAVISGLQAWVPSSAPGATTFYGVDRTSDIEMLGGCRYDGSALLVSEAIIDGLSLCTMLGDGQPDHVFINPKQYRNLVKEMGAKVEFKDFAVNQDIGFRGFEFQSDAGVARVFSDRYCISNAAFGLQLDSWELGSMGAIPEIFDADSDQEMLREGTSDGYELRIGGYANLACHSPGYNVQITLPTV